MKPIIHSLAFAFIVTTAADAQLLTTPYPAPSTNGALHYNRAMLSLGMIPQDSRELLAKPIWEAFGGKSRDELKSDISQLAHAGRHAVRACLKASSCRNAEFGIDYADYGHSVNLPHCQPMLELGRLLTLSAIYAQIEGSWDDSAAMLFEGIRMGRHMLEQPTLAETITGVRILENNYFALAFWAAKCPDESLVHQAFVRFEAATNGMVRPGFALANEASIIEKQMTGVIEAYPDGPWAEMLLDAMGEFTLGKDRQQLEANAIAKCQSLGVPKAVFQSESSFEAFVSKLRDLRGRYFRSLASCMILPPQQRHEAATKFYNQFKGELSKFTKSELIKPDDLVNVFATHEAERTMVRLALAVAGSRKEGLFPTSLNQVAPQFHGQIPTSPYDGSEIVYKQLNAGKDFSILIPAAKSQGVELAEIEFSSLVE